MKYFFGLLAISFISHSALAQLRCIQCTNCETLPSLRPIITCAFPTTQAPPTETTLEPGTTLVPIETPPSVPPPIDLLPISLQPPVAEDLPLNQLTDEILDDLPPNARKRRNAEAVTGSPVFSCFEIRVPVGTATQVHRGCVQNGGSTNQTCWRANNNAAAPQDCRICSGQECNSASGIISSVFLTITAVFILLKMK